MIAYLSKKCAKIDSIPKRETDTPETNKIMPTKNMAFGNRVLGYVAMSYGDLVAEYREAY